MFDYNELSHQARQEEIRQAIAMAHQMRAEFIAMTIRRAPACIMAACRFVAAWLAVSYKRTAMRDELNQLHDHILADFGMTRGSISEKVAEAYPRPRWKCCAHSCA